MGVSPQQDGQVDIEAHHPDADGFKMVVERARRRQLRSCRQGHPTEEAIPSNQRTEGRRYPKMRAYGGIRRGLRKVRDPVYRNPFEVSRHLGSRADERGPV
jgi:hypothetical protein